MNLRLILAAAAVGLAMAAAGAQAAAPGAAAGSHASLPCTTCHTGKTMTTPPKETCLKCHESYQKLGERTAKLNPNPHSNHRGEQACTNCHSMHAQPRFECNDCHTFDMKMKATK